MQTQSKIFFGISLFMATGLVTTALEGTCQTAWAATYATCTEPSTQYYSSAAKLASSDVVNEGIQITFGKDYRGNGLSWYVLGADSDVAGANTMIFAATPLLESVQFSSADTELVDVPLSKSLSNGATQVYANNYGVSNLREQLNRAENGDKATGGNEYFTKAELGLLNKTEIKEFDFYNKDSNQNCTSYSVSDKLYAPTGIGATVGARLVYVGSGEGKTGITVPLWYGVDGCDFWLSSTDAWATSTQALSAKASDQIEKVGVNSSFPVRPASNLNLQNVLFVSRATASAADASGAMISDQIFISYDSILRFDGKEKNIGTVTYDADNLYITRGTTASQVVLLIQYNHSSGGETQVTQIITSSKSLSKTALSQNYNVDFDFSKCKIWLEITDTDGLTYAVEATDKNAASITSIDTPSYPSQFTSKYQNADAVLKDDNSGLSKTTTVMLDDGTKIEDVAVVWSTDSYDATAGYTNKFTWRISDSRLSQYTVKEGVKTSGTITVANKGNTSGGGGSTGGNSGTLGGNTGSSGNTGNTTGGVTGNIDTTTGDGTGTTTGGTTGGNSGNTGNKPNGKKHGTTDGKNDKNKDDKNKDDKNNGKNDKNGSDGSTTGENGNGNNGGNAGTIGGNGGNTSGSGNGNSGSTSGSSGSSSGNGSGTIVDTKDIPTETKNQITSVVEKILKRDSNIKTGGYVKSDSEDISFAIPEDILKDGRSYYLVTADEDGNAKILQNESTEDGMFSATGEADTTYQIIYEEGVPLASMISDDGTLMDDTDAANCYWHWGILAVTLAGVALALFLGKKSKKYFMIVALVTTAINAAFMVGGNCIMDKIFLLCEIALMLLAYVFLLRENGKIQEA